MESLVTLLITCFSVLSVQLTSRITEAQQCQASVDGISLSGHVMSTVVVDDIGSCSDKCAVTPGCQSINFYMKSSLCELNNKTVENTPSHKVQNNRAVYFKNPDPLPPEPVDGNFTEWSNWTSCSLSCGNGTRYRSRSCTNPAPAHGGKNCTGTYNETQNCNTYPCPVNGIFTEWSSWTSCSLSCGKGTRYRSRSCTNPAPAHGGKNCTGPYKETKNCNTQSCPVTLKNSVILRFHGSNQYWQDLSGFLSPVLQDASKSRWVRCWRAAFDGWNVTKTFHPKCDKQGPTVTIVRVGSYIFGGYSDVSWDSSSGYTFSTKAFLFSLYNTRGYSPVKLPVVKNHQHAIYRGSGYGPTFGGHDMYICNQASSKANSYLYVHTYKAPPGCGYLNYCSFYTGKSHFTPSDVEVFYETTN